MGPDPSRLSKLPHDPAYPMFRIPFPDERIVAWNNTFAGFRKFYDARKSGKHILPVGDDRE